jgi:tetratricopeptide (TPR) repeat protein
LNLGPGDPITYFTRGNAHLFSERLELALADFTVAVEIDPTSGRSIYGRGLVRELMGNVAGAAEDSQRARELGYDDQNIECEA